MQLTVFLSENNPFQVIASGENRFLETVPRY